MAKEDKKRKVLIIHVSNGIGGAEFSLVGFLKHTSKKTHYILILSHDSPILDIVSTIPIKVYTIPIKYLNKNIVYKNLAMVVIDILRLSYKIFKICKDQNIGTIYCNTQKSIPYVIIPKFMGLKIIVSCRDRVRLYDKIIMKYLSDFCLPVSYYISNQLSNITNKQVIYNAVFDFQERNKTDTVILKEKYNLNPKCKLIGCIGSVIPWKNIEDFIEIGVNLLHELDDIHFFIIGETNRDCNYFCKLQSTLLQYDMESKFTFTGFFNNIEKIIPQLDIIVHTAIGEPFGRIIIESMSQYKPVVAYASGGIPEIINDNITGFLIPPNNIHLAVKRIKQLLLNSDLYLQIVKNAKYSCTMNFDIITHVRMLETILFDKNEGSL